MKEKKHEIDYLDYSRRKLKSIPKEVLDKKDTITALDISGNNFPDFYSIINELIQFKKLKMLKINIFTQEQAKYIIDSMPNLEYLNDEPINDETNSEENKEKEKEKEKNNLIKLLDNNFKPVFKRFKEFYKINKKRKVNYLKIIEIFNNKCNELNIKENKAIEKLNENEIKKELVLYKLIFNELNKVKDDMNTNNNYYEQNSVDKLLNIMEENEKIKNRCYNILNSNEMKNKDNKENKDNLSIHNNEKQYYKTKLILQKKNVSNENRTNSSLNKNTNDERLSSPNNSMINKAQKIYQTERNYDRLSKVIKKANNLATPADLIEFYDEPSAVNTILKNKSEIDTLNIFDDQNNDIIIKEKMNTRIINLTNLLEIINQTYKIRYNRIEKQKQGIYNKGTLEQDLYSYLKSRYGLKNLIIEWNMNILTSIQSFYKTNGEVFLFASILKNELDEDSIEVLTKIKNTVNNILNLIYDYNLTKIKDIKQNKEFINENEWKAMSGCLYSDDDFLKDKFINAVSNYILNLIKKKDLIEKIGEKILFEDFMNLLIIFNMKLRKSYLYNLFSLFIKEDTKRIGIINVDGFKQIIKNTGIIKDEQKLESVIEQLIQIADKEGSGQITFNDTVQCLDNLDLITDEGKIKFLDKLSNMNF